PTRTSSTLFPYTTLFRSYVQTALRARLKEGQTITMTFEITGDNPVFDYRTSPNNICGSGTPGTLSLYVQRAGDNLSGSGPYAFLDRKSTRLNSSHRTISY